MGNVLLSLIRTGSPHLRLCVLEWDHVIKRVSKVCGSSLRVYQNLVGGDFGYISNLLYEKLCRSWGNKDVSYRYNEVCEGQEPGNEGLRYQGARSLEAYWDFKLLETSQRILLFCSTNLD